ncbi:MAG: SPOR domain-containing protein [Pseudomonadota bacterium]
MASDHNQGDEDLQAQISAALARRGQRQQAGGAPRIEPTLGLGGMGPGADRGTPSREALNEDEPAPEIPPAPVHFRRDDEPLYPPRPKAPPHKGGRRSWLWFLLPVVGVPVVVLIALFYYLGVEMQGEGVQDSAPLIAAPEGPDKVKPTNEGGMAVEGMDSAVLNQTGNGQAKPPAEQLLPPPEEPLTPPSAPPSGAAPGEGQTATSGDGTAAGETSAAPAVPSVEVPTPPPAATAPASGETGAATAPAPAATTGTGTTAAAPAQPAQPAATQPPQPTLKPVVTQTDAPTPKPLTTQTATAGSYRIQLAALQSEEAATTAWSVLQKKYPDLLGSLTATILKVDLGAQGIFYRVQGGPLADRQAAEKLCGKLDQRGQACLVVRP